MNKNPSIKVAVFASLLSASQVFAGIVYTKERVDPTILKRGGVAEDDTTLVQEVVEKTKEEVMATIAERRPYGYPYGGCVTGTLVHHQDVDHAITRAAEMVVNRRFGKMADPDNASVWALAEDAAASAAAVVLNLAAGSGQPGLSTYRVEIEAMNSERIAESARQMTDYTLGCLKSRLKSARKELQMAKVEAAGARAGAGFPSSDFAFGDIAGDITDDTTDDTTRDTIVVEKREEQAAINWEDSRKKMDETRLLEEVVAFTTDVIGKYVRESHSASVSAEHVEEAASLAAQVVYENRTHGCADCLADEAAARAAIAVSQLPGSSSEASEAAMDSQKIAEIAQDTLTELRDWGW